MWKEITNNDEIQRFMERVGCFHDSCIKEMSYISGAYVNDDLSMLPFNKQRILRVIIQRQHEKDSMIEMEFRGLKCLKLFPDDEHYDCIIFDSAMLMKDGNIYWYDSSDLLESESEDYTGTLICASELRWRSIENHMGEAEFYRSDV